MKIIEAINRIDALKHNTYSQNEKVYWLSSLDAMIKRQIIDTHEADDRYFMISGIPFPGYHDATPVDTELLVPAPFDEIYLRWLEAQIDYANGEYDKYNNSIAMYQACYDAYANDYNRTHMPKGRKIKFF